MLSNTVAYVCYAVVIGGSVGFALYVVMSILGALPAGTTSAVICVLMGASVVTGALLAHRERVKATAMEWWNARRIQSRHRRDA